MNGRPKKPENDPLIRQIKHFAKRWSIFANLRASALHVTAEQFGDTRNIGCPETTLLSVTDNANTDYDSRRSVGMSGAPRRSVETK
ncbi:hypothetical protein KY380_05380 [Pseudomonas sp. HD6421]|uniref:hypothetical protein n=1 Tax=Pseudomonas sp. HD6421 TaxID=2860319 RepID=UPI0021BB5835|nr:hypothetical protein [Pseudomonas sp. HD6421]MCT8182184.1 hypothetical protein [Pseudomonas sp. HD6421]